MEGMNEERTKEERSEGRMARRKERGRRDMGR